MTLFQFHTNIRYHGANICNLPGAIRRKPSLASFKSSLKKKKKKKKHFVVCLVQLPSYLPLCYLQLYRSYLI